MTASTFPIVGIGASAGGLEAFRSFFENMPGDCGMAFVVVLHLPADRKSMLPEILARWTAMRVLEGVDGAMIEPNCVYVPPPHSVVTLAHGRLGVGKNTNDAKKGPRPIDSFFGSLGSTLREQAVGIVLSGTGSDGALGLKAIKECGGLTIVQGPGSESGPQYPDMPAGAIATGAIDLIAPIEEIPGHLMRMKGNRLSVLGSPLESAHDVDVLRLRICAVIRTQLGHDFSNYRDKTFLRRVQRRMQVVNVDTLEAYANRLQSDRAEVVLLFRDLLIRVTSFFRDKDAFETLENVVVPQLFEGKTAAEASVRVWVPGCATGEEAYSLAILLCEHLDRMDDRPKVQVFATDIDDAAIATARLGRYPETLLTGLSQERRDRFFRAGEGSFVVSQEVRQLCTFSTQNLVRDPPFSRMDLVSCRNLLIYLDAKLQEAIIPVFHYALNPGGILLLGGSESVSRHADLFEPLDKHARIFTRRDTRSPPLQLALRVLDLTSRQSNVVATLTNAAPPGSAEEFQKKDDTASLTVLPDRFGTSDVRDLQHELVGTQEELQSLAEEHQTALEELRSSNEELHSVNEEMQSTNEELQTAKEELQAVNEELNTVNSRLSEKVGELDEINADLRNLFDSTQIATIFVDRNLLVRSFTPAIAALYSLIPSDQGRPLTDIVSRLHYTGLREDVARVLKTLQPLERRVAREDRSTHYIMRILPYRAPDSSVNGAVITFTDVTSIVQAEATLQEADARKDVFLATLSHELRNPLAPIRNAASLLKGPHRDPEKLDRLEAIITRQVGHMSSLLDDLLDVSRMTRGSFLLKRKYSDINEIIDAAVEAVQPAADAKKHTLRVTRVEPTAILEVDPVRITQVISNLLTNAVKYTDPGGEITVSCRLEAEDLVIAVRDNGLGLAAEQLAQVFTMFTRVDSEIGRREGGLGIGLALVKGLVDLHGGRIEAISAGIGKGSEFVISLPRSLVVDPTRQQSAPPRIDDATLPVSRRILIVDDNVDGAESLGMLLESFGHQIYVAHNGEEAMKVASEWFPEIGILDIGMPDLNGYEVARRIRSEAWGETIQLIAMTGWGQENDIRLAFAAGFDHHLTKPVDVGQLTALFTP